MPAAWRSGHKGEVFHSERRLSGSCPDYTGSATMARRAAVTLLIALVASLLPAALWAQEAAEGAYIPEW